MPRKLRLIDGSEALEARIRAFIKENRRASMRDVAVHCNTTREEVERILKPPGVIRELPRCEALFCTQEGRFGFKIRNTDHWFCHHHRDEASHEDQRNDDAAQAGSTPLRLRGRR